jgi:hypothetical protein
MKCAHFILGALLAPAVCHGAALSEAEAEAEGRLLARELTSLEPLQGVTNTGKLHVLRKDRSGTTVPVRVVITPGTNGWTTIYESTGPDPGHSARLVIHHTPGQPNRYELTTGPAPTPATGKPADPPVGGLMVPFAGSDFWIADLGLDFLHWPLQRVLRKELRRGQSCNVLESRRAVGDEAQGYVRVVAWIDIDTGGIVEAEAYDAAGKLLKRFYPRSFRKIEGRWEIKELDMTNRRTGSRTTLEFDPPPDAPVEPAR